MSTDLQRRAPALVLIILIMGSALFLGVRLSVYDIDVPNPDIAGILYNADGLLRGELPYRDTVEIKPPGSFLIVAGIFAVFGRSIAALHWAHTAWLLLGAPAIWLAASRDAERLAPAIATSVYLFYVGMFTYNYSSWMVVPYAWAFAAMQRGLATGSARWSVAAGAAAALAVLTIQRAAVLGLLAPALYVLARRREAPGARPITVAWWTAGAAALFGAAALPWALGGALPDFVAGVAPLGVAGDYADAVDGSMGSTIAGAAWQLLRTFAIGLALAGLALACRVLDRRAGIDPGPAPIATLLFLAASILGAALGGARFYLHYLVQYVPALALLCAFVPRHRAIAGLSVLALLLAVLEVATGDAHRYEARARRLETGATAAQAAGAHIAARTSAHDTIFGWGWTAWPVYFWADRRATGGLYKPLGTLTTFNRNTEFEAGSDIVFRPGPAADAFIAAFDRDPPAYVVLSPSYTHALGARVDPLAQWDAMTQRLQRDYRPEALYGDLTLLRRVREANR
jgi:hypothetical protein